MRPMRRIFHRRRVLTACQLIAAACAGLAICAGLLYHTHHATGRTLPLYRSYSIPAYGGDERIIGAYRAKDGHFVLHFLYRDHGVAKADYFDTARAARLFPDQEAALAKDGSL